jgi:hypothetical protein
MLLADYGWRWWSQAWLAMTLMRRIVCPMIVLYGISAGGASS